MSTTNSRQRKSRQIHNSGVNNNDSCKFIRCADQLTTSGCEAVVVRHYDCINNEHESQDERKQSSEKESYNELSHSKTIIITTTSFSIPNNVTPKHNTIYIKPLIVLDLNGILCHRVRDNQTIIANNNSTSTRCRSSIGRIANTDIIPRSDLLQFLQSLHQHFALAVWTSATAKTAKALVKMMFPEDVRVALLFVWHRGYCNLVKREEVENGGKRKKKRRKKNQLLKDDSIADDPDSDAQTNSTTTTLSNDHQDDMIAIKSLSRVWTTYPIWDETNTLLLDDSPDKCPRRFRGNAIHPPSLRGTETCHASIHSCDTAEDGYVNDDEANQRMQEEFFKLLAQHWTTPRTRIVDTSVDGTVCTRGKSLSDFLEEHAATHNIIWEEG